MIFRKDSRNFCRQILVSLKDAVSTNGENKNMNERDHYIIKTLIKQVTISISKNTIFSTNTKYDTMDTMQ